jgi:hypothetical protein
MNRIKFTVTSICFLVVSTLLGQVLTTKEYQAKYPGESAVYLIKRQTFKMDLVKDTLSVTSIHKDECIFLDVNAKNHAKDHIYSGSLSPVSNISAETRIPLGNGKFKSYPVKQMSLSAAFNSGVFYDDLKKYEFVYPQLQEGAITSLSYSVNYLLPQLINPFRFSAGYPCELSEVVLECHNDILFDTLLFNVTVDKIEYSQVKKGSYTIHTWRMRNVPSMVFEGRSLDVDYYAPQIYFKVNKINTAKGQKVYFENQQGLYDWLYTFVDKVQNENDASIQKLSDSIRAVSKSDYELSKNIFYWVQDNVNYVAFENGYAGFIPRYASDVYNKRYGDCKDMANLIYQIHKSAGLNAHIAWIGTRDIPYKITGMPSPCDFNHMIAAVEIKDSTYFLDATGKYQPFGFPTDHIQGKQALLSITSKEYRILDVPVLPSLRNAVIDTVYCKLNGTQIIGTGIRTLEGYPKINFAYRYLGTHKEEKEERLISYLKFGNNKCKITDAKAMNMDDKDKLSRFTYSYELPDYVVSYEDEIFVNLHLFKIYSTDIIDTTTRKLDYMRDYKSQLNEVIVFEIPVGYTLKSVPQNRSYRYEKANFEFSYVVKDGKVVLTKKIAINSLLLEKEYFSEWNTLVTEMNKAYKENLTLKKIK